MYYYLFLQPFVYYYLSIIYKTRCRNYIDLYVYKLFVTIRGLILLPLKVH